jgi:hypothetical protein
MMEPQPHEGVCQHFLRFFAGHTAAHHVRALGPAADELPRLRVVEFAPGPKTGLWVYATVGACEARDDPRLEFLIAAPEQDLRHVELLFMCAWYHRHHGLGTGHTFPIGEPWLPGSECQFFLVSLPYPYGPQLEVCEVPVGRVSVVWLLPITSAEKEFKVRQGLEALEERFDSCAIEYWDPKRKSVV